MKPRPLFLSLFYTLFPAITLCVFFLILAVNFTTERVYESIIHLELKNRTENIFSWLKTTEMDSNTIQKVCLESSNKKSVRVTIVNEKGVVIGDSHKSSLEMDNHLTRPEIKNHLTKGLAWLTL